MFTRNEEPAIREALFYEKLPEGRVLCTLCPHRCRLREGQRGACRVRENRGGVLLTLVYGKVVAAHVDPVEKKPLFHYHPGSRTFSVATVGCNLRCRHCQNHEISQYGRHGERGIPGEHVSPDEVVQAALRSRSRSISFTYTEPTVFFEFAYDTARLARQAGLGTIFVTNGYMSEEAVRTVAPYLEAANVDLKGLREDVMRRELGAKPGPVLDTIRTLKRLGVWVEVTTLIVPGSNDSDEELRGIADFLASVDRELPWHISAFHPDYLLLDRPRTPRSTLERAMKHGRAAGLRYVYAGNLFDPTHESTVCPSCTSLLIERLGFSLGAVRTHNGHCPDCGEPIPGVGLP